MKKKSAVLFACGLMVGVATSGVIGQAWRGEQVEQDVVAYTQEVVEEVLIDDEIEVVQLATGMTVTVAERDTEREERIAEATERVRRIIEASNYVPEPVFHHQWLSGINGRLHFSTWWHNELTIQISPEMSERQLRLHVPAGVSVPGVLTSRYLGHSVYSYTGTIRHATQEGTIIDILKEISNTPINIELSASIPIYDYIQIPKTFDFYDIHSNYIIEGTLTIANSENSQEPAITITKSPNVDIEFFNMRFAAQYTLVLNVRER